MYLLESRMDHRGTFKEFEIGVSYRSLCMIICCAISLGLSRAMAENVQFHIENLDWNADDMRLIVTYDLIGSPERTYEVDVFLKKEGRPDFTYQLKHCLGAVGRGNFVGLRRQIIWEYLRNWEQWQRIKSEVMDGSIYVELVVDDVTGYHPVEVGLHGGIAVPLGRFKKGSDGNALMGYGAGVDLCWQMTRNLGWVVDISATVNPLGEGGLPAGEVTVTQWRWIWPMTGLRLRTSPGTGFGVFIIGQVGAALGKSPRFLYQDQNVGYASGQAVSYGLGTGIIVAESLLLTGKYIYSRPKFKNSLFPFPDKLAQTVNMIRVDLGVIF